MNKKSIEEAAFILRNLSVYCNDEYMEATIHFTAMLYEVSIEDIKKRMGKVY